MKAGRYIGASLPRSEDRRLLTGAGKFVADIRLPDALAAAVLRSEEAHARIIGIDAARARALPGVIGVFTAQDIGPMGGIPMRLAPREALQQCFQKPLARERVRYVGEPIALVVAEDRYIADDALELIEVHFDRLPPVVDLQQARSPDATVIHASLEGNVAEHIVMRVGDPEQVLARAPVRLKATFSIQRHTGVPMETRGLLAAYDQGTDTVTVWGAAKVPHFNRQILADLLGRPESTVRMVETEVGGGFGVRGEFYPEDFLVPWAAIALGRPIRWIEDRREHMMATNHSREQTHAVEVGVRRDGTIEALVVRGVVDMGAYIRTNGFVVPERAAAFIPGPYRIRNFLAEVDCMMTTRTPTGSYRGPGRYEATFVRERTMDLVARELGLDPADVRRRNFVRPSEMPYNVGTKAFGHDVVFDSGDYPAVFDKALELINYKALREEQAAGRREGRYLGIGLAPFVEKTGVGPWESARVRIDGSGSVAVYTGVTSVGQGMETSLAQICAEQLQVPPERIIVRHGDTAVIPLGAGAYGSRGTVTGGSALWKAAGMIREKLIRLAAHRLEVSADDLELRDGAVVLPGTDLSMTFRELARVALPGQPMPSDMEPGLDISAYYVVKETAHPYGAHVAVVEVDPDLGLVKVRRYLIAFDIGVAVNPMLVEGQLVGGFAQGLGGALLEELKYSEAGQLLTGTFVDYLLPTAVEMPSKVEVYLIEEAASPHNALGLKGAGEGGTVGVGAAIANAVEDALAPLGIRINALPLSPNAIAELVRVARERG
jgi:carbon-monoxide dehydrogenase large subunit